MGEVPVSQHRNRNIFATTWTTADLSVQTRFRKGQFGNPGSRPRRTAAERI